MAIEQPTTLRVVSAGEVVEAEWMPSGVPGLALAGRPLTTQWRLVHIASGRAVSRSAEHPNPDALRNLARRIAPMADWTDRNVAASVPRLRQALDHAISSWRVAYPLPSQGVPQEGEVSQAAKPESTVEPTAERLRGIEHERLLLRRIVRNLHAAMDPGAFADALASLSQSDREFARALVHESTAQDVTGVVQAIRRPAEVPGPRPSGASTRPPVRPRPGGFGGHDAAAS